MHRTTRREALWQIGLGTSGLLLPAVRRRARPPLERAQLNELADLITNTPRDEVLAAGAKAAAHIGDHETLLAAVFLAGVREVRPRHVGGKLHCVLMVESAFQLAERAPREDAWLLALWNLDDFKRSQARDVRDEGDWVLGPVPETSFSSPKAALTEFHAAMEAWDAERADRALVGLLPHHDSGSMMEFLWPYALRSFVNIGHKVLFGAQVERTLRRIGWEHARPALRSLVNGLLFGESERSTTDFGPSEELAHKPLPVMRKSAPERSADILAGLRSAAPADGQDLIAEALASGLAPDTIWDGLRLYASELFLRRPRTAEPRDRSGLLSVHYVSVTNALGYIFESTRDEHTRRLALYQAAAWLPRLRDAVSGLLADGHAGPTLLAEPPAAPDPTRLRRDLARKGLEHHEHKYAAAIIEESGRVDARWAPHLLAPATTYLPGSAEAETELCARSLAALRATGVL